MEPPESSYDSLPFVFPAAVGYTHWLSTNSTSFLLDNVHCDGNETSLLDCDHSPLYQHDCTSSEQAGVNCYNGT